MSINNEFTILMEEIKLERKFINESEDLGIIDKMIEYIKVFINKVSDFILMVKQRITQGIRMVWDILGGKAAPKKEPTPQDIAKYTIFFKNFAKILLLITTIAALGVLVNKFVQKYLAQKEISSKMENRTEALKKALADSNSKLDLLLDFDTRGNSKLAVKVSAEEHATKEDFLKKKQLIGRINTEIDKLGDNVDNLTSSNFETLKKEIHRLEKTDKITKELTNNQKKELLEKHKDMVGLLTMTTKVVSRVKAIILSIIQSTALVYSAKMLGLISMDATIKDGDIPSMLMNIAKETVLGSHSIY